MKKSSLEPSVPHILEQSASLYHSFVSWLYWYIPPVILSAATAFVYYPSLHYNFQFDDVANIYKFFNIRYLTFSDAWLTSPRWIPFWLNAVNYRLGKFDPFYYRLSNVSFHAIAGILVFFFVFLALSGLKKESFYKKYSHLIAYITALVYLLHPVQTQTVSYVIQGRMEGLAGLFVIAMAVCFLYAQRITIPAIRIALNLMVCVLGFIACGTKEITIIAPLLMIVVDWFFVAQGDIQDLKKRWWVHLLLSTIIFCFYLYFLKPSFFTNLIGLKMEARNNIGNLLTEVPGEKVYPLHFFISQFKVIVHYLCMFVWPFTMSVEYDWKLVSHFFAPDCILPLFILIALAGALYYRLKRDHTDPLSFCFIWFFIAIAPRSSIIPSSELLADYKTYLGSCGIMLLLGFALAKVLETCMNTSITCTLHPRNYYLIASALALPLGFCTYDRNKVWRSSEEFWSNIIANAPGKARAYNNLGVALSEKGKIKESIPLYKKAITMDPHYPDPRNNLAVAYSMDGKMNLAIQTLQHAIKMHPYYPEAYNNLASFYITNKDFERAEKVLKVALQLRPHYGKAYFNLGKLYMEQGRYEESFDCFKSACTKADLDNEAGYTIYASVAVNLKKYDDAIFAYQKLLGFQANPTETLAKLANVYLLNNNYDKAGDLYKQLLGANQNNGTYWYGLGESLLHLKQPEKALAALQQAQRLNINLAQLPLKIISCLEQVGRLPEARLLLVQYINDEKNPPQFKQAAQMSLAKLDQYMQAHKNA